jgi:hypothetical protein
MRYKQKFYYWCREAVCKIAYIPDMNKVYNELFEHLLDRHAYFMAKGLDEDTAADKTLEAMGDPKIIAPQLAAIHRPGWAYAMVITRIVAALLLFITLFGLVKFAHDQYYLLNDCEICEAEPYVQQIEERLFYAEPNIKCKSDGYTFTVEKAAKWNDRIVIRMKVTNPRPWARASTTPLYMWAQDSNGVRYTSHSQSGRKADNAVFVSMDQEGLTAHCYDFYLYGSMEDVSWLTLGYDRDGRNILLHIDLTEG